MNHVIEDSPRSNFHDVNIAPIRSAGRNSVREILAVLRQCKFGQHGSAIFGKRIGIDQDFGRSLETLLHVVHALVLKAIVLREEEVLAVAKWRAISWVIHEF